MRGLFEPHIGEEIGVNIVESHHIDSVKLTEVHEEYFTVMSEKDGNLYHIPYLNLVKVLENPEGVKIGGLFKKKRTHCFVAKIGHIAYSVPM